jgi:hypothetical protein
MKFYRKQYLCICEGLQEKIYLKHLERLIKNFPEKIVTFNTYIDSPFRLTKTYEEYDGAALFDFDFNQVEFEKNIKLCDKLNNVQKSRKKKGRRIYHAYSNINFDLWLILHKEDYNRTAYRNDAYISDIRRIYNLNINDDIKNEGIISKIFAQITIDDVKDAILRADKIRRDKLPEDVKHIGTSLIYSNPDFSLHEFLKIVLQDSGDL